MRELKARLVIVSNRLPVSVSKSDNKLQFHPSTGGLATAMSKLSKRPDSIWVGWPGISYEELTEAERDKVIRELKKYRCYPIFLTKRQVDLFYSGYSNSTIWPLFHYHIQKVMHDQSNWDAYIEVNQLFADVIGNFQKNAQEIWVHDYHLMLLPEMLRKQMPTAKIGFFLHTPFPSYEVFRLLPQREHLLKGLISADLVGFHNYDYVRHFLSSVLRTLGFESSLGVIRAGNRLVSADSFPIGIDYQKFARTAKKKLKAKIKKVVFKFGTKVILSVDRNDYSKGILERLDAYELFLEDNPSYKGRVVMVLLSVPSRGDVEAYQELRQSVEQKISHINGKYGHVGWTPITYQYKSLPLDELVELYVMADVMLVTPLRDGMNLVAKEYIATRQNGKGVLILSERAGAASELQEALLVNPNDTAMVADSIKRALDMPLKEQRSRLVRMQDRIASYTSDKWANGFLNELKLSRDRQSEAFEFMSQKDHRHVAKAYKKSARRLLLLDYDGTLNEFVSSPALESGRPSKQIKKLLKALSSDPRNRVVIISGRTKSMLQAWFKNVNVDIVAEHGAWIRSSRSWQRNNTGRGKWFKTCKEILIRYAERTPGAIVEEKETALVWHYRAVLPDLAYVRRRELKNELRLLLGNSGTGIFEGEKILEIKPENINKGTVSQRLLNEDEPDFILAIGDDYTDEDTFKALPDNAYTIKIGLQPTEAKLRLESIDSVHNLLKNLAG